MTLCRSCLKPIESGQLLPWRHVHGQTPGMRSHYARPTRTLDTPAMPSTAGRAFSPGGTSTGLDDGIAGAPKRATRQVNRAALVSRKAAL